MLSIYVGFTYSNIHDGSVSKNIQYMSLNLEFSKIGISFTFGTYSSKLWHTFGPLNSVPFILVSPKHASSTKTKMDSFMINIVAADRQKTMENNQKPAAGNSLQNIILFYLGFSQIIIFNIRYFWNGLIRAIYIHTILLNICDNFWSWIIFWYKLQTTKYSS